MAMMMDRNKAGFCMCDRCATRSYRESVRGTYRAREKRAWREDTRDLPLGESWMQDEFDAEGLDDLPYWQALDTYEAWFD